MDDERVVNRLRKVAASASPDPAFLERMYEELAEELRFRPARQSAVRPSRSGIARRLTLLAAAAVLTLSMVGGALFIGAIVDQQRIPDVTPSLLERIREADVIRIAVRPDRPQVAAPGGAARGIRRRRRHRDRPAAGRSRGAGLHPGRRDARRTR